MKQKKDNKIELEKIISGLHTESEQKAFLKALEVSEKIFNEGTQNWCTFVDLKLKIIEKINKK